MKNNTLLFLVIGLVVLGLAGYAIYASKNTDEKSLFITNFEECVEAGYEVAESYPRQCRTPGGELYVEEITEGDTGPSTAVAKDGCFIGGCSQQICSDEEGAMSTCEYKPEYACYKSGICEKQQNGKCGWTETTELKSCLDLKLGEFSK